MPTFDLATESISKRSVI